MSTPSKLGLGELAALVEVAPFHRWLGVKLVAVEAGKVVLELPWRDEFVSDPEVGYTHGGILASFVDIAADYAIAAEIGRGVPTIDLRVDFHKIALPGPLRAEASIIRSGRTVATAEARIYGRDGSLVASGRGAFLALRR